MMGLTDPSAPCCLSKSGIQRVPEEGAHWWEHWQEASLGDNLMHAALAYSPQALQLWPLSATPGPCPELRSTA